MGYAFYGWENCDVGPLDEKYAAVTDPCRLYDLLSGIWCADTCAPRMRAEWSAENKTRGQCSITAFLAQDIFGGEVHGMPIGGGNFHCYNVVGDCVFDLTSEQFAGKVLDYANDPVQLRETHFLKTEKRMRYEYLKRELDKRLGIET